MPDKSLLKSLNEQLATKQADARRISDSFQVDEHGRFSMSVEQRNDYVKAVDKAKEVKAAIDALKTSDELDSYLNAPEGKSVAGLDAGSATERTGAQDFGSMFLESKAFKQGRELNGGSFSQVTHPMRATIEGKSIYNFSGGSVTHQALGQAENAGIRERQMRKAHIRDLFPKSSTKAAVIYSVRETGWVNNARQVNQRYAADGVSPATGADTDVWGNAPKSTIQLSPELVPIATIKHSLDAHKHILDDEPRLRTFLNTRMLDGVKYAEDYDLLHSTGSGEQITGLFNVPGVQEYTGLAADRYDVQVRRAITKAMLAEYDPTGIVLSPTMFENIETEEGTDGHLRVAVSVAIGASKQIWRLDAVVTTAMPDATFVIGAFGMGAQLHDRELVSVEVSTEHANNFTEGLVTFLASERVGFEVVRPESFVIGTWTDYTG